ncbi:unnamed protein product [Eruca vesicaria subsp. sativa]|uniref:Uncharacterized protein n=1 Tax=Eruca vesicaria subsp. sativa TaxID=29727 RepID=A0ABC8KVD2_ERUVS|nr:unnamed protein product [Eruca vesicaria subsp. sativa]
MPKVMVIEAISTTDYGINVDIDEIYEYIEGEYGYKILDITLEIIDEAQNRPHDAVMEAISTIKMEVVLILMDFTSLSRKQLEHGLTRRVSQYILEKVGTGYEILDVTPEKLHELNEAAEKSVAMSDQKDLEAKEA